MEAQGVELDPDHKELDVEALSKQKKGSDVIQSKVTFKGEKSEETKDTKDDEFPPSMQLIIAQ